MCFNSNCPAVWVEKSKIGFQDGGYGGHVGFPIGMILAIFHLHVNLLLHYKFQLNLHCGLQEDVQNRLSIWRLWRPSWIVDRHNFSSFPSRSCPVATEQISAQIDQGLGRDVIKWFSRWELWCPSWIFDWLINFSYLGTQCSSSRFNSVGSQSLEEMSKIWILNIFPHINV